MQFRLRCIISKSTLPCLALISAQKLLQNRVSVCSIGARAPRKRLVWAPLCCSVPQLAPVWALLWWADPQAQLQGNPWFGDTHYLRSEENNKTIVLKKPKRRQERKRCLNSSKKQRQRGIYTIFKCFQLKWLPQPIQIIKWSPNFKYDG